MNSTDPNAAIVLFAGGQHSTVCLVWALDRFERVETIGFDYGQRHRVELDVRGRVRERISAMRAPWATRLGEDYMVEIPALAALSESALTRDVAIAVGESGLPTRSCPGAISCSSRWPALSPTAVESSISWRACARPTIPGIRIAATTRSKPCSLRSISAWSGAS